MRPVSTWFCTVAAFCATVGMAWGIQLAATHDYLMSPAHAHLNQVGWVTMGLFGLYYRLTSAAAGRLAWVHFALAVVGVFLMVPGIALAILGKTDAMIIAGSFVTIASMVLFVGTVLRHGFNAEGL